jgi:hypothetical protein
MTKMTERVARLINNTVDYAIKANNMEDIDYILSDKPFPGIPKNELEAQTFSAAYSSFIRDHQDNAIKYLIFDYNIHEDNSLEHLIKIHTDIDQRVIKMFESRNIKKELGLELNEGKYNYIKSNNKTKV